MPTKVVIEMLTDWMCKFGILIGKQGLKDCVIHWTLFWLAKRICQLYVDTVKYQQEASQLLSLDNNLPLEFSYGW